MVMAKAEQLSFKQIRYFQAIAEAGSFRRAADRIVTATRSLLSCAAVGGHNLAGSNAGSHDAGPGPDYRA